MRTKRQDYNEVTVVELHGELDIDAVDDLNNIISSLIAEGKSGVVLDMRGVDFIDSVGLEHMLWARDYCDENKCQLRLAGLDESCEKILEITRLDNRFDSYAELAEAVKSFT